MTLRRTVAAGIVALAVSQGIGRFAFTPILPKMGEAFSLSPVVLGGMASANYLGYLLGAVAAIAIPVAWKPQSVFQLCLLVVAAATGLMAATASIPVWFGLRFVAGVASAGVFVFASAIVLRQIGRHGRSDLAGVFYGGVGCGIAVSGFVILIVSRLSPGGADTWRVEWLVMAALAAVLSGPVLQWLGAEDGRMPAALVERRADNPPRRPGLPLALLAGAYFLEAIGYIVAGTFLVAIVAAGDGSTEAATVAWIVAGLAAAPSALLWSWVAERLTLATALVLAYVGQAAGLVLLTLGDRAWPAAAILFGGTFVGITSLTITGSRAMVDARQATRTIAGLTAIFGLGQIIGPLLAAAFADEAAGLSRAMPAAAGLVLIGAGLVFAAGRMTAAKAVG